MSKSRDGWSHSGIVFPDEVLRKLDDRKGKYLSRNKYLLQIVEEHLNEIENENNKKNGVWGSTVTSQQATNATPTPSTEVDAPKTYTFFGKGGLGA